MTLSPRKHNATQGVAQALVRKGLHQFGPREGLSGT